MHTRSRLVFGSLAGALSIHLVMIACSSGGAPNERDGGLADVVRDVLDVETRDAHAGGDGGTSMCNCPEPARVDQNFSGGAVTFEGTTHTAVEDFSAVSVAASLDRGATAADRVVTISFNLIYYLSNNAKITLSCSAQVRPDRSVVQVRGHDAQCTGGNVYISAEREASGGVALSAMIPRSDTMYPDPDVDGVRVTELTDERVTITVPQIALNFRRAGATNLAGTIAPITIRSYVPGRRAITPWRMYRP